jgi:hypothetical protein
LVLYGKGVGTNASFELVMTGTRDKLFR